MNEADLKRLLSRMSSVLGHELRQPLAVIKNSAYFVKSKLAILGQKDAKILKHLGMIEDEIQTADRMITEIHSVSKSVDVKPTLQSLDALVEEVLGEFAKPEKVKVVKKFKAGKAQVKVDVERLKDALNRLLVNGGEAMPEGGTLTVSTAAEKRDLVVEIADTGSGIPKEAASLLFMPFNSTKSKRMGLGLFFARQIAEKHQGGVKGRSLDGKGSSFKLRLPQA
jgi:signal transduction histidine kinase